MISIFFTASNSLFGKLIRWITRGKVSHVVIEYPSSSWGGRWVAEATIGGVRKVPSYKSRHNVVMEFECLFETKTALKSISKYFGNKYDYSGLFIFGCVLMIWDLFKRKIKLPLHSHRAQFCSELVTRFLQEAKLPIIDDWDPELSSPQRILTYCEQHPKLFKKIS